MNLVVFDIDGTLTDTKNIDDQCFINSLKECWNCELQDVDWSVYKNVTDTGLAKEIYLNLFNEELKEKELLKLKRIFVDKIRVSLKKESDAFNEIQGAGNFFHLLKNKNLALAFATGGWKETAEVKLKNININLNDFTYATSNDHYSRKEIVLKAIKEARDKHKTTFEKITYFGDGVWDYEVTNQLNIEFIGIDHNESGKLSKLGAKHIFKNYVEADLIFNILNQ